MTAPVLGSTMSPARSRPWRAATAQAELNALVVGHLADRPAALSALTEIGAQARHGPEHIDASWRSVVAVELEHAGAGDDRVLLDYAHQMMILLDPSGTCTDDHRRHDDPAP